MKKTLALLLAFGLLLSCFAVRVEAKTVEKTTRTNWQIAKELCRKQGYNRIKLIDENNMTDEKFWRVLDNRKGKPYIVVSKVLSVSDGTGYGWYSTKTKGTNYIIGYNKKIPKGKRVRSYVIWNPNSNECDDILYVVDSLKYR